MFGFTALCRGLLNGRVNSEFVAAVITGLVVDALVIWLRPAITRVWQLRALAALVPLTIWSIHYAHNQFFRGGLNLEVEFWTGIMFMSVLSGLALSSAMICCTELKRLSLGTTSTLLTMPIRFKGTKSLTGS